jgi:osmotically-inducible protein OsmY
MRTRTSDSFGIYSFEAKRASFGSADGRAFLLPHLSSIFSPATLEWVLPEPVIGAAPSYSAETVKRPNPSAQKKRAQWASVMGFNCSYLTDLKSIHLWFAAENFMSHDDKLQQAVLAELSWEPSVTSAHIGVTANDGVIVLTGHVESYVEKYAAETAARRVKGVKAVAEELEVNLPEDSGRDDSEIAQAAVARLAWDVSVPKDAVKIKVEKGCITLTGTVDWHYQKDAAERDIRGLLGIVALTNQITIRSRVNVANLSNDITKALHRSRFDPTTVTVTTDGGQVRLTGSVHSWHDRAEAETTSWAAPGTIHVENDLVVIA